MALTLVFFSIKKGKLEEAEQSLLKVFGPDYDAKQDVINISDNLQHLRHGSDSQSDECFKNAAQSLRGEL